MGNNVIFSHSSSSTPPPPPPTPPPEQYQSSSTRAEALQRSTVFRSVYRWQISYEYMCICSVYSSTPSPPDPLPIHPKIYHFPLFTIYTLLFAPFTPLYTHLHPFTIPIYSTFNFFHIKSHLLPLFYPIFRIH